MKTKERIVQIDGQEIKMRISGATPILYRNEFKKDMFVQMQELDKGEVVYDDEGNAVAVSLPDGAVETLLELAYILARQGDSKLKVSFIEWLDRFSFDSLTNGDAFGSVLLMIRGDEEPIVEEKKSQDQQSE